MRGREAGDATQRPDNGFGIAPQRRASKPSPITHIVACCPQKHIDRRHSRAGEPRNGLPKSFPCGSDGGRECATVPAAPRATAATGPCDELATAGSCVLQYADYPNGVAVTIPVGLQTITTVLSGGSGGGGTNHGAGGAGAMVVSSVDMDHGDQRTVQIWLGQSGTGWESGGTGWSNGGHGGSTTYEYGNGMTGGGSSAIAWADEGADAPIVVAGGGGGAGGSDSTSPTEHSGGGGGVGAKPAGAGMPGQVEKDGNFDSNGRGGAGGATDKNNGAEGDGNNDDPGVMGAGGGGGGGYAETGGGGGGGQFGYDDWNPKSPSFGAGGGGGAGSSYSSDEAALFTAATVGDGSLIIQACAPGIYFCQNSSDPRSLVVPDGVSGYRAVASGGAGGLGHNTRYQQGTGAVVTGVIDVKGLTELDYWVGCDGDHNDGAGFGRPGKHGGTTTAPPKDGGHGGGTTMLAYAGTSSGVFEPIVAAGGGGGAGGNGYCFLCETPEGGQGGSSGGGDGTTSTALPFHGGNGDTGDGGGGVGGCSGCETTVNGSNGSEGHGGGGGGGSGFPYAGHGGGAGGLGGGGGGGAGDSWVSGDRVTASTITASGRYDDGFLLLVPIMETTTLTVQKVVTGSAAAYGVGPFTVDVECAGGGPTKISKTITVPKGGSQTVPGIPVGSVCTVTEIAAGGATIPAPPQKITMSAGEETVVLSNAFETTSVPLNLLSLIQAEDETQPVVSSLPVDDVSVEFFCDFGSESVDLPGPSMKGEYVQFDLTASWNGTGDTVVVDGVPVGAHCLLSETGGVIWPKVSYTHDGQTVTDAVTYSFDADKDPAKNAVLITDTYETAPLTVSKVSAGTAQAPPNVAYPVRVSYSYGSTPFAMPAAAADFAIAVGDQHVVHNLPIGVTCITVETDHGSASGVSYSPSQEITIAAAGTAQTITNVFDPGVLLVSVGVSGTGASWSNDSFDATVTCRNGETVEYSVPVHFEKDGGFVVLDDPALTAGLQCSVTENHAGGASRVEYWSGADPSHQSEPVTVALPAVGSASLAVGNVFDSAPVAVVSTTSGDGSRYANTPTTVTVSGCTFNGKDIPIRNGSNTFALTIAARGGASSTPEIVQGAECDVVETSTGGSTSVEFASVNGAPEGSVAGGGVRLTVNAPADATPTTVRIDNVFDLSSLGVDVAVVGDAAWAANTDYRVEVTCTFNGHGITRLGPGGIATLEYQPDGKPIDSYGAQMLRSLPINTDCSATQTDSGGATAVGYAPEGDSVRTGVVSITSTEPGVIGITDTFEPATLSVTKALGGNDADSHTADQFSFERSCTFNGQRILSVAGGPILPAVFTLAGGQTLVFESLPIGAACTVQEFGDRDATLVTPGHEQAATLGPAGADLTFTNVFDVTPFTIAETITGAGAETYAADAAFAADVRCVDQTQHRVPLPDDGRVILTAANAYRAELAGPAGTLCSVTQPDSQLASAVTLPAPITLRLGEHHELPIVATYNLAHFTVSKTAYGATAGQRFGFNAVCSWQPSHADAVPLVLASPPKSTFSLASGEHEAIAVLEGADCTVTETDPGGAIRTIPHASGAHTDIGDHSATAHRLKQGDTTMAFENFMPGTFPATGSELTFGLVAAFTLLLLGLALAFVRRVRRRYQKRAAL